MGQKNNYYIAIVGKNPLPVYISALQHVELDTKVYLIHSEENDDAITTKEVAHNIERAIIKKKGNLDVEIISTSKSDGRKIINTLQSIVVEIKKQAMGSVENGLTKVRVDYTGGTKMMAATVYSYFQGIYKNSSYVEFNALYVSNGRKLVDETKFGTNDKVTQYSIADSARKNKITADDIVNLHGYKLVEEGNRIGVEDFKGIRREGYIDSIEVNDFTLNLGFKILSQDYSIAGVKRKHLVEKFFLSNDLGEKLGGTECQIKLYVDSEEVLKLEQSFINNIKNISNIDIKNKVKLLMEGNNGE